MSGRRAFDKLYTYFKYEICLVLIIAMRESRRILLCAIARMG